MILVIANLGQITRKISSANFLTEPNSRNIFCKCLERKEKNLNPSKFLSNRQTKRLIYNKSYPIGENSAAKLADFDILFAKMSSLKVFCSYTHSALEEITNRRDRPIIHCSLYSIYSRWRPHWRTKQQCWISS